VYVMRNNGEIGWKDLGAAKEIDASIEALRVSLRDPKREDTMRLARALDAKVMQPVRGLAGNASHLLVSPDGELNVIPLGALVDEKGKFGVENYLFTYLSSGRDLVRMGEKRSSESGPLVIGNPAYGEPESERATENRQKMSRRPSIAKTRDLTDTYFSPLSGTEQETRAIKSFFPDATYLTGDKATETSLKQAKAPRILHIATHGFFLVDQNGDLTGERRRKGGMLPDNIADPLLRSGLAFAGANRPAKGDDDGLLTALEASGLDLWGTELVVLSACDTGLGEIRNGEGVYGLRRSFGIAGAESIVMSLWPVSDQMTRDMMISYYKYLKQGAGRGEALRRVQLEMLKKAGRSHPFYWASFIQSGDWGEIK
ncbi:MAG: CHAT domain-containing protein, partial [Pyrinomonadaceae bacterium]